VDRVLYRSIALYVLIFGACSECAFSQETAPSPLVTERPTLGPTTPTLDLVPAGSLQIETGGGTSIQRNHFIADMPESYLRYGLTSRIELRFLNSNMVYQYSDQPGLDPIETGDSTVSAKISLAGANTFAPTIAIASLSLPVGREGMTSGGYDPSLLLAWSQTTHRGLSLIEAVQGSLTTVDGEWNKALIPILGAALPVSKKLAAFVDYAPNMILNPGMAYALDGGLSYARNDKQLFDVRTGYSRDCEGTLSRVFDIGYSYLRSGVQQFDVRVGYVGDIEGPHAVTSFGYSVRYDEFIKRHPVMSRRVHYAMGLGHSR
jgi:hypothetical protein